MILVNLILIPIIAGLLGFFIPRRFVKAGGVFALLVSAVSLVHVYNVFINKPVKVFLNTSAVLSVDNLSGFVALFIGIFGFLVVIYSLGFFKDKKLSNFYYPSILVSIGASFGVAVASNFLVLLVFWGILGTTLYLLINESGADASSAAKKTFIIVGGSDALLLLGICLVYKLVNTLQMESMRVALDGPVAVVAYLCIALAAFAKAGAMPLHTWIPDAAEKAPVPATAFLPASLDKLLGIYLLARISMNIFVMNKAMGIFLMAIGSLTIVAAVMMALIQHDAKRLLGYHAVSQVGYMVLGIGTMNPIGIAGGIFHMLNNAIYKSCLFLTAGSVEKEAGTTDLDKLGGLGKLMPVTFVCFLVASFAISGIPPFNGFVSKWMVYQGIIELGKEGGRLWIVWLCAAMFGSALTLASFMKLTHSIFLGVKSKEVEGRDIKEAGFLMSFPMIVLAALCVLFGIFAFAIPLRLFIDPAVSGSQAMKGIWVPTTATILIIAGLVIGYIIYLMGTLKSARTDKTFIGGEKLTAEERVTGTEFYNTVSDIGFISRIYKRAQEKLFDIYDIGAKITFGFNKILSHIHNGVLLTYLAWCLLGMIVLFIILIR